MATAGPGLAVNAAEIVAASVGGNAEVLVVCVACDGEDAVVDLIAEPRPLTRSVVHPAPNITPAMIAEAIAARPDTARPLHAHILIRCPHGPRGTRDLGPSSNQI